MAGSRATTTRTTTRPPLKLTARWPKVDHGEADSTSATTAMVPCQYLSESLVSGSEKLEKETPSLSINFQPNLGPKPLWSYRARPAAPLAPKFSPADSFQPISCPITFAFCVPRQIQQARANHPRQAKGNEAPLLTRRSKQEVKKHPPHNPRQTRGGEALPQHMQQTGSKEAPPSTTHGKQEAAKQPRHHTQRGTSPHPRQARGSKAPFQQQNQGQRKRQKRD